MRHKISVYFSEVSSSVKVKIDGVTLPLYLTPTIREYLARLLNGERIKDVKILKMIAGFRTERTIQKYVSRLASGEDVKRDVKRGLKISRNTNYNSLRCSELGSLMRIYGIIRFDDTTYNVLYHLNGRELLLLLVDRYDSSIYYTFLLDEDGNVYSVDWPECYPAIYKMLSKFVKKGEKGKMEKYIRREGIRFKYASDIQQLYKLLNNIGFQQLAEKFLVTQTVGALRWV
ncbi:MAG: hypothetical protein QXY99_08230 [Thermoproteota archaeon]